MLLEIPTYPNFAKLSLRHGKAITEYVRQFPCYCDFNFTVMWWANLHENLEISQLNGNLVVLFKDYVTSHPIYSFLGTNHVDHTTKILIDRSKAEGYGNFLKLVPATCLETFQNLHNYEVVPDEDQFDYIYLLQDLAKLEGAKYADNRKVLRKFKKQFPDSKLQIMRQADHAAMAQLLQLAKTWEANHPEKHDVVLWIQRALTYQKEFPIEIANAYVHRKLVAFRIYEGVGSDVMFHLSCRDPQLRDVDTYLMNALAINLWERGYRFVNRMEDLGLPNLRQAKLSWRPSHFLKKYIIRERI